jgi:hypothetical protein
MLKILILRFIWGNKWALIQNCTSNENSRCAILLANKTREDTKRLGIGSSEGSEAYSCLEGLRY